MEVKDGILIWTGEVSVPFEKEGYRITLLVVGGIGVCMTVFGAMLDMETMWISLLCSAAALLIAAGVCWLFSRAPNRMRLTYHMTEESIIIRGTRSQSTVRFRDVLRVYEENGRIDLETAQRKFQIFIPQEDFETVQRTILDRVRKETGR